MVVSGAVPILSVMPIMCIRLVYIPLVVSGADAVRLSVTIAFASIVVPVLVTARIAVTLPRSAARPWHALSLQNRGRKQLSAHCKLQLYEQCQGVEEDVQLRNKKFSME